MCHIKRSDGDGSRVMAHLINISYHNKTTSYSKNKTLISVKHKSGYHTVSNSSISGHMNILFVFRGSQCDYP